jgi:excisionase family DNA binding protein
MNKLAFSVEQAAEQANCSRAYLYNEIKDGNLRAKKMGRKTIILGEDLTAYLRALPEREAAAKETAAA